MKIRIISETDVEKFHKVFSLVLSEGFPEYSSELIKFFVEKDFSATLVSQKMKDGTYSILAAEEKNQIVGFLVFEKLYGGVSYCPWLGVIKEMRGRGVGKTLVEKWEEEIKKIGGHKLMMMTQANINRKIFTKYGFTEEGHEEKSWFGLDAWVFGKTVGKPKESVFLK